MLDIGYHHRAQEKVAERQSWHTYIPYTDRVDYLAGVQNNLNYLLSVEKLAGIEVPERAQVIRVMLCELYRINSHLLYYGTYAQDIGALSPVFYMFSDRELILDIAEAICGARMHPNWFRIGGVAEDLPQGWDTMVREFLDYMPARLKQYDRLVVHSSITRARTRGVGALTLDEAVEWGVSGPNLRACGLEFDYRKKRPYSGYEQFDFEIPTATSGDSYDRLLVRIEEMRQSLRIIRQCLDHMPSGPYKSHQQLATPPVKEPNTMHDIESLINHFLGVSWGPVCPPARPWCRPSPCAAPRATTASATATPAPTACTSARPRSRTCRRCRSCAWAWRCRTSSPFWAAWISSWPTWTAEEEGRTCSPTTNAAN